MLPLPNGGREFNINCPQEYDGSHWTLQNWVTQVCGYLMLNSHVYESDHQKITFALMFMTKGAATLFAKNYQNEINLRRHLFFETFKQFVERLKATFESGDQTALTILKLSSVTQGR
ncbi:hypothetical protein M404DRAFT_168430 [Pisolithus tinctorius Marx 270]|uniref:DUF4939 domain-containing protein n=1 Tax=Pisolithus tinctorius Marx 270 TaxID=870435 RepID=A0A0C3J9P9_PISTI|nr:hypothetical protein M404DRAFT_168430 [Pisolithus tinctorius Marx 270]